MKITDILKKSTILVQEHVGSKDAALTLMIEALSKSGQISDSVEVARVVWEREKIMSTGIGKGFALPHGKTNSVSETVGCFLTLDVPIDFNSLDNLG
ncbi:MAG: PTS sugar transporter subunit IIA [Ignavibacteriae bacterium]|nr:PTS sugar transporter subunit IIA [Ignavibacteriota bacterium]